MADNVPILDATNTSTPIASDDVAGVQFQRVKLDIGGDGASVPFTDPATGAKQDAAAALLTTIRDEAIAIDGKLPALSGGRIPVVLPAGGSGLTDAELRATPVPVSGTVTVANPTAVGLTDAQLRATPVPISGTVSTGGLTDAQLRASAVPVSLASAPLPNNAATVAGQDATNALLTTIDADIGSLVTRTPALTATIPPDTTAGVPMRPVPADLWRCSFADVGAGLVTSDLTLLQTGAGQAVSQAAGSLVITTGTTTNAETLIRTTRTFRGAHLMRYRLTLSQRIANNNFQIALADLVGAGLAFTINSATSVTVTFPTVNPFALGVGQSCNLSQISGAAGVPGRYAVASVAGLTATFTVAGWPASGSGTLTLWGYNSHRVLYTGTTATNASYDAQRRGWASGDTTLTINTTASPGHLGHMQSMGQIAGYADALVASNAAYQFTPRASRLENIPDDSTDLHLWVQVLNGTTAPASTTTLTLGMLSVEMTGRQKVYLSGGDQMGAPMAPAVQVANFPGTQTVAGTVTSNIGTGTLSALTTLTGGAAAEDAATTSNPHIVGGIVRTANAATTIVAGDAVRQTMTRDGANVSKPYAVPEIGWNASVSLTTTTATALIAAAAAGLKRHITALQCINTGTVTELIILDGATERWRITLPLNVPVAIAFPTELVTTAATALNVNLSIASTSVRVNAQGYTAQ